MMESSRRIVTTEAVLWEWLNALSHSSTRALAAEGYRRAHSDPVIEVIPCHAELITAAVNLFRSRADKDWSLTDCFSLVVMEQRGLHEALTTDKHFEQAGMTALMLGQPNF
jgi:predicted nucleic acid-binding protein